jgi:hypothetical protein
MIALATSLAISLVFRGKRVTSLMIGRYKGNYIVPLYLYNNTGNKKPNQHQNNHLFVKEIQAQYNERRKNFASKSRAFIDLKYGHHDEPEEILGYIYPVLHSPTYRQKYAGFLKIDFPRIPFVDERQTFEKLSALGWRLVQAHLLKEIPAQPQVEITKGSDLVDKPTYNAPEQRLYINPQRYFFAGACRCLEFPYRRLSGPGKIPEILQGRRTSPR